MALTKLPGVYWRSGSPRKDRTILLCSDNGFVSVAKYEKKDSQGYWSVLSASSSGMKEAMRLDHEVVSVQWWWSYVGQ